MPHALIVPHLRLDSRLDLAVAELEFLRDSHPLVQTGGWRRAKALIWPAVAACILGLPRGDERILASLAAADGRAERPQDLVYRRLARARGDLVYAFLAYGDPDNRSAELIVETDADSIALVVNTGWDWNSFRGYVLERPTAKLVRDLVGRSDLLLRRRRELEISVCVFEDWADGTALRISSSRLSVNQIAERVNLEEIARVLGGGHQLERSHTGRAWINSSEPS